MAFLSRISSALLMLCVLCAPLQAAEKPEQLNTELAFAAAAGSASEVTDLLKRGADPNKARNSAGVPALSLAAMRKDAEMPGIVSALLDAKASINIEDAELQTPLFYAARNGSVQGVQLLMDHGADVYHADKQKNTARDVAFTEGHKDVVTAMDAFQQSKAKNVMQQYEQRDKQIAERDKEIAERDQQLTQRGAEIEKQNQEMKAKLTRQKKAETEPEEQPQTPVKNQPKAEAPAHLEPAPARADLDVGKLQTLIYDLSYHSCAAEYWRFCRSNKQDTGMSREELRNQMEAQKTLAYQATQQMKKEFGATDAYLQDVVTPSAQQVYDQLAAFPTNSDRKDEGIGHKKDMDARCDDIADQWEVMRPGSIAPPSDLEEIGAKDQAAAEKKSGQRQSLPVLQSKQQKQQQAPNARNSTNTSNTKKKPKPPASAPSSGTQPTMNPDGTPRNTTTILP